MDFKVIVFSFLLSLKYSYSAQKKHVVMIVADDLGWNDVSFHGSNQFITPNIDTLAYSGVILHNYYVMPLCSPSRSALMTGVHPIYSGMYHNVLGYTQPYGLPLNMTILPQYLKQYGYKTRAVGKWHLGHFKGVYTPTKRGFDSHLGYWTGHEGYYNHNGRASVDMNGYDLRNDMSVAWNYKGKYATDIFTRESVDIIHSHNTSEPLFLYLAHLACHAGNTERPLEAPAEIVQKFSYIKNKGRRIFAAMAWKIDQSVGKVVRALADKNMLNDTIIIFTTDNGGATGGYDLNHASNWPLKGIKDTIWEGGVRGASFVWSVDLPKSKVSRALMHIQDWVPTILGAIDPSVTSNSTIFEKFTGRNMWPVLKGDKDTEYDELIIQRDLIRGISALRKKNWKLVQGTTHKGIYDKHFGPSGRDPMYTYNMTEIQTSPAAIALLQSHIQTPSEHQMLHVRQQVTLSCDYCGENGTDCTPCKESKNLTCLFDISKDPCERNDLSAKYPSLLTDLAITMLKYVPVAPLNKPNDPRSNPKYWNNTWVNWLDYVDELLEDEYTIHESRDAHRLFVVPK